MKGSESRSVKGSEKGRTLKTQDDTLVKHTAPDNQSSLASDQWSQREFSPLTTARNCRTRDVQ